MARYWRWSTVRTVDLAKLAGVDQVRGVPARDGSEIPNRRSDLVARLLDLRARASRSGIRRPRGRSSGRAAGRGRGLAPCAQRDAWPLAAVTTTSDSPGGRTRPGGPRSCTTWPGATPQDEKSDGRERSVQRSDGSKTPSDAAGHLLVPGAEDREVRRGADRDVLVRRIGSVNHVFASLREDRSATRPIGCVGGIGGNGRRLRRGPAGADVGQHQFRGPVGGSGTGRSAPGLGQDALDVPRSASAAWRRGSPAWPGS